MPDANDIHPAGGAGHGRLAEIAEGRCDDPFGVLGEHKVGGRVTVTAFAPDAASLRAVRGGKSHDLAPVEGVAGAFTGKVPGKGAYRLHARSHAGHEWDYEDPYRFGPVLGEMDEYLLGEGTHRRLWEVLGAHVMEHEGSQGTHFAVWAPNARRVSVVGVFNHWDGRRHPMRRRGATGVWEIFLPDVGEGAAYKYEILGADGTVQPLKADPVGFGSEHAPSNASVVRDIRGYGWHDGDWMQDRAGRNARTAPISVYEVHLPSWRRRMGEGGRPLSYKELADELVSYATDMGFTHLEFLPVSEFPFDGSWGYQPVGLFAPTIRMGPPHEFRDLVDAAHRSGLGVILDWVPGHFPGRPILPGVMMIEAGAQLASFLFHCRRNDDCIAGFTRIENAVFRGQVVPGQDLVVLAREVKYQPRRFISDIQGIVADRLVFEARITGMVI